MTGNKLAIKQYRPLHLEYHTMSKLLNTYGWNSPYSMSEEEFVGKFMFLSGGGINPTRIKAIYNELMEEAGL